MSTIIYISLLLPDNPPQFSWWLRPASRFHAAVRESSYKLCRVSRTDVWLGAANVNLTARAVQKVRRFVDYTSRYIRNRRRGFIFWRETKSQRGGSKSLRFIPLALWISAVLVHFISFLISDAQCFQKGVRTDTRMCFYT